VRYDAWWDLLNISYGVLLLYMAVRTVLEHVFERQEVPLVGMYRCAF
jgi:hypothetical protein